MKKLLLIAVHAIVLGERGIDIVLGALKLHLAGPRVDLHHAWVYKLTAVE